MKNLWLNHLRLRKMYYIAKLKRLQRLDPEKIKQNQEKRLRKIINHAYNNVQFYHDLFNSEKIKPSDIKTVQDLKRIPIITKKDVRDNYPEKIVAKNTNLDDCFIANTSGSTGIPLKICFSYKDRDYLHSLTSYIYLEAGVRWFDKIVAIQFIPNDKNRNWFNKFGKIFRHTISVLDPIEDIFNELCTIKPNVIYTYPSILSLLAIEKNNNKSFFSPRQIFTTGEALTDSSREKFINIFGSDILRNYVSVEFGPLAFECKEHTGYHILTDNVVMEFTKNGKDIDYGEIGEVLVTGLNNYKMPLIRYRLGDIAVPSEAKCSCGRGLPLVKHFVGREDDFLVLPSGRKISPRMINHIEHINGIASYKIIQKKPERIVVKIVKSEDFNGNTTRDVIGIIKSGCAGEEVSVEVELVDQISKGRTGKRRTVVSEVSK